MAARTRGTFVVNELSIQISIRCTIGHHAWTRFNMAVRLPIELK